jgi:hypothetical protein
VDAILALIHRWNLPQFLYNWQTLIAGVLAVLAAWRTIRATVESANREVAASQAQTAVAQKQIETTVRLEQERVASEVDALRKSLGVELRLQIATALVVYDGLYGLGFMSKALISGTRVEDNSRMAAPIIYPANAGKIGLLGAEATDVMIIYHLLETARNGTARLMAGAPNKISGPVVMEAADAFLAACKYAREVLPRLRTGDPSRDANDEALIQKINDAVAARA